MYCAVPVAGTSINEGSSVYTQLVQIRHWLGGTNKAGEQMGDAHVHDVADAHACMLHRWSSQANTAPVRLLGHANACMQLHSCIHRRTPTHSL